MSTKSPLCNHESCEKRRKRSKTNHTYFNKKDQNLYLANGKATTGINVYQDNLYVFDDLGNYNEALTKKTKRSRKV